MNLSFINVKFLYLNKNKMSTTTIIIRKMRKKSKFIDKFIAHLKNAMCVLCKFKQKSKTQNIEQKCAPFIK